MTRTFGSLVLITTLCSLGACGKSAPPKDLAPKTEVLKEVKKVETVDSMAFEVVAEGAKVVFDLEAPFERQDGEAPAGSVSGNVHFDLKDITKSTGLVQVDISGLEIYQQKAAEDKEGEYGERTKSDMQNAHMKDWLEIGESAPEEERKKNAIVQFSMSEVKDASSTDITAMKGDRRKVTFTGVGDFRLHQRTIKKEVKLEAVFGYAGDKPKTVEVHTVDPFPVALEEHDVRPRTAFGKLAQKTLGDMLPKVAKEAKIHVQYKADAKPGGKTKPAAKPEPAAKPAEKPAAEG